MSDNRSSVINMAMNMGIDLINKQMDVPKIYEQMAQGEKRTSRIIIVDDDNSTVVLFDQCYGMIGNRFSTIDIKDPTVTYIVSESAWIQLLRKRRTFQDCYFAGAIDIVGNAWIRDLRIWSVFFDVFKEQVEIPGLASIMLRPKSGVI